MNNVINERQYWLAKTTSQLVLFTTNDDTTYTADWLLPSDINSSDIVTLTTVDRPPEFPFSVQGSGNISKDNFTVSNIDGRKKLSFTISDPTTNEYSITIHITGSNSAQTKIDNKRISAIINH